MKQIEVFEPAMCCPTGVCGPDVDPALPKFAADVDWLKSRGVAIERHNLSQQPAAFAVSAVVKAELAKGVDSLPLTLVDGAVVCRGKYPTRDDLVGYAGIETSPSVFTEAVKELVAIGAAIGSNCEMCFKHHYNEARKLGVSKEDVLLAVEMAESVKASPARSISELVNKFLREPTAQAAADSSGGCCGNSKSGCC